MPARPAPALRRSLGLAAALVALAATPLWAHPGDPAHGLAQGAAHPFGGWDHLLAMLAVGLWAAQRGGRARWMLPLAFVLAMAAGATLGVAGLALPAVEGAIVLSVLLLGLLVAAAAPLPAGASVAVVAAAALLHGHAHGAEMPATVSGLAYAAGFCATTALLHATAVLGAESLRRAAGHAAASRLVRAAGAGIAVAALALALA